MPFQRTSFSGSTKNSQTVSGLAAIEMVRSTTVVSVVASMLLLLLLLCLALECFQPHVPELLEELLELGEPLGTRSIQAPRAVSSLAHEPRLLQDVQMLRDRRSRHVEVRCDLPRRELVAANQGQDLAPPRRGDGLQRGFHALNLSKYLRKKQLKEFGYRRERRSRLGNRRFAVRCRTLPSSRLLPAPSTTHSSGTSATWTGSPA